MKKARTTGSAEFDAFWAAYPRHTAKMAAKRRWDRLKPAPDLVEKILAALEWQCCLPQWQDEAYIPHASTYLNNARWEDEPPKQATPPTSSGREPWVCPHVHQCGSRSICGNATFLGKPMKKAVAS